MSGTYAGGVKARDKNLARDSDFYKRIGKTGGLVTGKKSGFASEEVDINGMTGRDRAAKFGTIGGRKSRRKPSQFTKATL